MTGGATVNTTVDERDSDMGGGAVLHDNRVEIERLWVAVSLLVEQTPRARAKECVDNGTLGDLKQLSCGTGTVQHRTLRGRSVGQSRMALDIPGQFGAKSQSAPGSM